MVKVLLRIVIKILLKYHLLVCAFRTALGVMLDNLGVLLMIRKLALTLMLFWCVAAKAADDSIIMDLGNSIALKKVAYNEATTQKFNDLVWEFHKADYSGTSEHLRHFPNLEVYEEWAKSHISSRAQMLKDGKDDLVLFYKGDEIIGGTYFVTEDEGKTIRVTCAGYKIDLPQEESNLIKGATFKYLRSKHYFPQGERLIVYLRNYSSNAAQLKFFGFVDSDYTCQEFSKDQYNSYEAKIS